MSLMIFGNSLPHFASAPLQFFLVDQVFYFKCEEVQLWI